ncbi:MAG: hypothetical protein QXG65_03290 [Thermoplasmata archaeon]
MVSARSSTRPPSTAKRSRPPARDRGGAKREAGSKAASRAARPKPRPAPSAAPSARPAPTAPAAPRRAEARRHLLSLSFLRDGDEFFARIETNSGQITEFKNRALDQLLTLVAGELEDLVE